MSSSQQYKPYTNFCKFYVCTYGTMLSKLRSAKLFVTSLWPNHQLQAMQQCTHQLPTRHRVTELTSAATYSDALCKTMTRQTMQGWSSRSIITSITDNLGAYLSVVGMVSTSLQMQALPSCTDDWLKVSMKDEDDNGQSRRHTQSSLLCLWYISFE